MPLTEQLIVRVSGQVTREVRRLELNHLHEPLPAETVACLRADILAAIADVGLRVDDVWELQDQPGAAGG